MQAFLEAMHFQRVVLSKDLVQSNAAVLHRMNGNGDIDCWYFESSARFELPADIIDVVNENGLERWQNLPMYGVASRTVTHRDGTVYTR